MSTDRQQLLDSVAKAVSDGAAVNWEEADSAAIDPETREMLRQLRIVAEIADLHRKTADEDDPAQPGFQTADAPPPDAQLGISDTWAHLTLREVIGRGAYGTVYRAWDAQLDRDVALKLIPEAVDRHYAALVIEEARLMARVRHPNVVTVFGATRAEGCVGLWMELIEGQTLEQILQDRGRFSAREAALIGCDVCEALAAVHGAGLLHRDVKAHNVMRDRNGRIVLMDFGAGLEQTLPGETPVSGLAGTPLYMAPELFRGGQPSVRSDVYSVGVLLYRLVTGRVPINARSLDEVRQAHLTGNVRLMRDERSDLPSAFVQIVERALSAEPARRFDSAGGFEMALTGLLTASSDGVHLAALVQPSPPPVSPMRRWLLAGAGLLLMLLIAGGVYWALRQRDTRGGRGGPQARFIIYPPANTEFESLGMSPDGRALAFTASGSLWVRPLDALEASNLPNTGGSHDPFWSPDGRFIAYFKSQSLWIIPAAGGESRPLCAAWNPSGGSWAPDGTIIFAADLGRAIYRVSVQTGERQELRTQGTHGFDLQWPSVLPNGQGFIYSGRRAADGPRGIFVGRFDEADSADRWLMATDSNAQVADGRLLFVRDGLLMAQPFNLRTLQASGKATRLADRVPANLYVRTDYANFSVGGGGPATLAFLGGTHVADRELNIVSRDGRTEKLLGASEYRDLAISHSARELAYEDRDPDTGARDIWIADIARKQTRRLAATAEDETAPVWSADDREIYYTATRNGRVGLYHRPSDGLGDEKRLFEDVPSIVPYDLTPQGLLAATRMGNDSDIWLMSLLTTPMTRTPFRATRARENEPRFSPDGKWIAYSSTDSGSRHVYIEQVSAPGRAWQVSVKNGREPQWRQDGKELYYHGPDRQLMAVPVDLIPNAPHIGEPTALFTLKFRGWDTRYHYTAYPDGQRFIVASPIDGTQPMPVTIVLNWTTNQAN